ncbi:MAG: DUF378 domain-containing protein [Candidatus Pacebacteria bacterium]|nr:DUF378 domain-containing protein [Candidatus Paceibacterota bacterium]
MKLHKITFILLIIGGLNWLLIGVFNWGVGDVLGTGLSRIVYILVGLSALVELFSHGKTCKACSTKGPGMSNNNPSM